MPTDDLLDNTEEGGEEVAPMMRWHWRIIIRRMRRRIRRWSLSFII